MSDWNEIKERKCSKCGGSYYVSGSGLAVHEATCDGRK